MDLDAEREVTTATLAVLRMHMRNLDLEMQRAALRPVPTELADVRTTVTDLIGVANAARDAMRAFQALDGLMTTEAPLPYQWSGV